MSLVLKAMKYKMIVSDYGETLVHTGESIEIQNVEAICKYQKSGGIFCIATGREWSSIARKIDKYDLCRLEEIPVICCYGATIVLSKSEKVLFEETIDVKLLRQIVRYMDTTGISYSVSSLNKTFSVSCFSDTVLSWKKHSEQFVFENSTQLLMYLAENDISILKIEVYDTKNMKNTIDFIELKMKNCLKCFPSKDGFLEAISANADKGKAVQFLSNYYNISLEELVVVGDALNDMEMFDAVINKFAVSNAINAILDASNRIIDNSDYLGISRLVEDVIGGE